METLGVHTRKRLATCAGLLVVGVLSACSSSKPTPTAPPTALWGEIKPIVSEGSVADGIPRETSTETETSVMVRDGQTILLGGLIRKKTTSSSSGLPVLSDIPLLDLVFNRTEVKEEKKEIVILITPHLVPNEMLKSMSMNNK